MSLNISLLEDIEMNKDKLNIKKAVKNLNKPLLIVHGEQDLAVPVDEAEEIYEWADKEKRNLLKLIRQDILLILSILLRELILNLKLC